MNITRFTLAISIIATSLTMMTTTSLSMEAVSNDSIREKATTHIVISDEDYKDPTGNLIASLKDNSSVVNLTIHNGFYVHDKTCYKNYKGVILEGLQKKPNLKSLTIIGTFDTSLFFNDNRFGDPLISPGVFLNLPHIACFKNLEEFKVVGMLIGQSRDPVYFYSKFLRNPQNLPNLKKFETTDPNFESFERP